ncbi:CoF synthetase [Xenorhabdus sp. DI]|uniref:F390 synthetase-related protein n=1 Tax=Xenorhabdus doucetiae TaxID=351671 RepID=UPI0019A05E9E|nr:MULTISPECIES: F390 synthetase-related protein [unclassified Xenorhabdus]MBD2785352.1 CoF synthetase [Xenorhabdus sp. 3]MBD2789496.1 CoF synthetase [Xenorhabdus sp. DI]
MIFKIFWYYWKAKKQWKFSNREQLEQHQLKALARFKHQVLAKSPYFSAYRDLPLAEYPLMNKAIMMENFDQMNTAGLKREELLACARLSEQSRDFKPTVGKFSVGMSSGTSGQRGIFVISPKERNIWAGIMLAKMLPKGLLHGERVALFLRAGNNLYDSVQNRWISFRFFDLFADFHQQVQALAEYQPTIIVAPAQVLRALALKIQQDEAAVSPVKVISVAEVLEPQDRQLLQSVFRDVGEIYQATEGFLACTCPHGTLHLNEEFLHIEPNWIDESRFNPIITDFTRETQPIVRYQLDDILLVKKTPCACGNPARAIERIEGRSDDQLILPAQDGGHVGIFADPCSRIIANTLPLTSDYRLTQTDLLLRLEGDCDMAILKQCQSALTDYFAKQGVDIAKITWQCVAQTISPDLFNKRRRIIRKKG